MNKCKNIRVGDLLPTVSGGVCRVISYTDSSNVEVEFLDEGGFRATVSAGNLRKGLVRNLKLPNIFGVGFLGEVMPKKDFSRRAYNSWYDMLRRCYSEKRQGIQKSYVGCSVDEEWHDFKNFHSWYEEKLKCCSRVQLDKDLLFKGNKVYSASRCCLLPEEINKAIIDKADSGRNLPTGVFRKRDKYSSQISVFSKQISLGSFATPEEASKAYIKAKEAHIRSLADLWRDCLCKDSYKALLAWNVSTNSCSE